MTAWTEHLKKYAADNNMTYKEAMKDENSKTLYNKAKPEKVVKPKVVKPKVVKEKTAPATEPATESATEPVTKAKKPRKPRTVAEYKKAVKALQDEQTE
jgi:hypothetical protein